MLFRSVAGFVSGAGLVSVAGFVSGAGFVSVAAPTASGTPTVSKLFGETPDDEFFLEENFLETATPAAVPAATAAL